MGGVRPWLDKAALVQPPGDHLGLVLVAELTLMVPTVLRNKLGRLHCSTCWDELFQQESNGAAILYDLPPGLKIVLPACNYPQTSVGCLAVTAGERLVLSKLSQQSCLAEYLICLARLGGCLARAHDPLPGNLIIWRGMRRLSNLLLGSWAESNFWCWKLGARLAQLLVGWILIILFGLRYRQKHPIITVQLRAGSFNLGLSMSGVSPDCVAVDTFYEAKPAWPDTLDSRLSGQAGFASIKVIDMQYAALVASYTGAVEPNATTIYQYPPHILVFGGLTGVGEEFPAYGSCRNVFMNKSQDLRHPLSKSFVIPEHYPEWNLADGYHNLVEFELDAGCLARAIVLILETPGSIAELGTFCMDETLRERLLVVVDQQYVKQANSFIFNGPIKYIRKHHEDYSLCSIDNINSPQKFEDEVVSVLDTLHEKIESEANKPRFSPHRKRDQFLLIADLIDLFRALLKKEIQQLLTVFGISLEPQRLSQMIWQLKLFNLIKEVQVYGNTYFVAIKKMDHQFLDYTAAPGLKPFSRQGFKAQVYAALQKDQKRHKASMGGF